MSRTQRSIWNFVTGVGSSVLTMLVGFVSVPLLIWLLGDEQFGAFRAVADWQMMLGFLELGFAQSVRAMFAEAAGEDSKYDAQDVMEYGRWIYYRLSVVLFIAVLVLAAAIPYLVIVSPEYIWDLRLGVLSFLPLAFITPLALYLYFADSRQHGYLINFGLTFQLLLITALSLTFAYFDYGIVGQCLAFTIGHMVLPIAIWRTFRRKLQETSCTSVSNPESRELVRSKLRELNTASMLMQFSGKLGMESDRILVGFLLGATAIVPFFATQRLLQVAQHQVLMLGSSSWAALAELHHQGERLRFNQRLIELTSFTAVLALAFCISIGVFSHEFVALWVGEEQFAGWSVVVAAATIAFFQPVVAQWKWAFAATGKTPLLVRMSLTWLVVNVTLSISLTYSFGLAGPLIGTAVANTFVYFLGLPFLLKSEFQTPHDAIVWAAAKPLLLGIPYAAIIWWLAQFRPDPGWIELAVSMAATASLYLLACWFLIWDAEIREIWRSRLRGLIIRKQTAVE
ncbi:oligosaccharide flippase family protein [Blastopirellula retiformator]|uniref:Polysaccharide biosynthesis protein n=1 Tax=Blastopirellula retiformator TaxID=2527970 RepID=A0A5C5V8M1_9BACT|nr:oligosaccharide flippase family protein [Blastopirellula retiformator]TWT34631.1 Polysaccharide biosynthesis protein [Blastopirellula retiformator]